MAERGAPNKKGLDYFPKMVNFYEDDKIFDLLEQYGPLGVTIYDVILTIVYTNGYYVEMPKEKLARMIIRKIGTKWVKKEAAVQVIDFCADIGLLHDALLSQSIITSVGIQKRYYRVGVKLMRRRLYDDKYWLLDDDGEPLLSAPKSRISSEESRISSEENTDSSEKKALKEKETKRKENKGGEPTRSAYGHYQNVYLSKAEHTSLIQEFGSEVVTRYIESISNYMASGKTYEYHEPIIRKWIVDDMNKAAVGRNTAKQTVKPNRFHNFDQVGYDYDAIVHELNASDRNGG